MEFAGTADSTYLIVEGSTCVALSTPIYIDGTIHKFFRWPLTSQDYIFVFEYQLYANNVSKFVRCAIVQVLIEVPHLRVHNYILYNQIFVQLQLSFS